MRPGDSPADQPSASTKRARADRLQSSSSEVGSFAVKKNESTPSKGNSGTGGSNSSLGKRSGRSRMNLKPENERGSKGPTSEKDIYDHGEGTASSSRPRRQDGLN